VRPSESTQSFKQTDHEFNGKQTGESLHRHAHAQSDGQAENITPLLPILCAAGGIKSFYKVPGKQATAYNCQNNNNHFFTAIIQVTC